jgi:hypothetical protein
MPYKDVRRYARHALGAGNPAAMTCDNWPPQPAEQNSVPLLQVPGSCGVGANSWQVVSVADFNLDGHPDVVWQDPVSDNSQVWFLN